MLNSNDRRPAFDAFFASIDHVTQTVFLAEATDQHAHLLECEGPCSLIDCMENVWDRWTDLPSFEPDWLNDLDRSIALTVADPERKARQRAYHSA